MSDPEPTERSSYVLLPVLDDDMAWRCIVAPPGPAGSLEVSAWPLRVSIDRLDHARVLHIDVLADDETESGTVHAQQDARRIDPALIEHFGWVLSTDDQQIVFDRRDPDRERRVLDVVGRFERLLYERAEVDVAMLRGIAGGDSATGAFAAVAALETAAAMVAVPPALREGWEPVSTLADGVQRVRTILDSPYVHARDYLLDPRLDGALLGLRQELQTMFVDDPQIDWLCETALSPRSEPSAHRRTSMEPAPIRGTPSIGVPPASADLVTEATLVEEGDHLLAAGRSPGVVERFVAEVRPKTASEVEVTVRTEGPPRLVDDLGRRRGTLWARIATSTPPRQVIAAGPLRRAAGGLWSAELPCIAPGQLATSAIEVWVNPYRYPDEGSLDREVQPLSLDLAAQRLGQAACRAEVLGPAAGRWREVARAWLAAGHLDRAALAFLQAMKSAKSPRDDHYRARVFARDPWVRQRVDEKVGAHTIDMERVRSLQWYDPTIDPHHGL